MTSVLPRDGSGCRGSQAEAVAVSVESPNF